MAQHSPPADHTGALPLASGSPLLPTEVFEGPMTDRPAHTGLVPSETSDTPSAASGPGGGTGPHDAVAISVEGTAPGMERTAGAGSVEGAQLPDAVHAEEGGDAGEPAAADPAPGARADAALARSILRPLGADVVSRTPEKMSEGALGVLIGQIAADYQVPLITAATAVVLLFDTALGGRLLLPGGEGRGGLEFAVVGHAGALATLITLVSERQHAEAKLSFQPVEAQHALEIAILKAMRELDRRFVVSGKLREHPHDPIRPAVAPEEPRAPVPLVVSSCGPALGRHFARLPDHAGALLLTPERAPGLALPSRGPEGNVVAALRGVRSGHGIPVEGYARPLTLTVLGEVNPRDLERAGEPGVRLAETVLLPSQPVAARIVRPCLDPLVAALGRLQSPAFKVPLVCRPSTGAVEHLEGFADLCSRRGEGGGLPGRQWAGGPALAARLMLVLHAAKRMLDGGGLDEIVADTALLARRLASAFIERSAGVIEPLRVGGPTLLARRLLAMFSDSAAWQAGSVLRSQILATKIGTADQVSDALDVLQKAGLITPAQGSGERWCLTAAGRQGCTRHS